jgi:hypothetical protein
LPTLVALQSALDTAHRAGNQGALVQKAIANMTQAISNLDSANDHHMAHRGETNVVRADIKPNFTAPPRPAPNRNVGLEISLARLKEAFDLLNEAPAGELGGYRAKVYSDIAAGAANLIAAINSANADFAATRPRGSAATNVATPTATPTQ